MKEGGTDLAGLQLTMMHILEDKGVCLGCAFVDGTSISVVEEKFGSAWNSNKEYSVSIDEENKTISINTRYCLVEGIRPLEFDENETRWWESREKVSETYQIIDGKMQYSKIVQQEGSVEDSLGGGVPGGFHTDEETVIYELPVGYKITDGIRVFTSGKAVKVLTSHKESNF